MLELVVLMTSVLTAPGSPPPRPKAAHGVTSPKLAPRAKAGRFPAHDQEILDRTLALVGGQAITLSDVRAAIELGLIEGGTSDVAAMTARLVDRELILREVQRYAPPAPPDSAVETRLAEITKRFASPVALMKVLETHGFSEHRLRAWLRDDLRTEGYLAQRFASAGTPERRRELVVDWLSDLRRRTDVVILTK
jgi:hypothetical protein